MNLDTQYMIILVGAPGSGKSTWADNFMIGKSDVDLWSTDRARGLFGKDENDQSVSSKAFNYVESRVNESLKIGRNVIVDATSMYPKARKRWIEVAKKFGAKPIAIVLDASKELLMERNKTRGEAGGRVVPENVIDMMLGKYVTPTHEEGFDEITVISQPSNSQKFQQYVVFIEDMDGDVYYGMEEGLHAVRHALLHHADRVVIQKFPRNEQKD